MKKLGNRIGYLIIILLLLIIFTISLVKVIGRWKDNKLINYEIEKINNIVKIKVVIDGGIVVEQTEDYPQSDPYWDYIKMNLIEVDFSELKKVNSDTVGWLSIEGTNINYPFVQGMDNDYYLTHSFYREYTGAGWVFLDYRNNINNFDKNMILYAHERTNGTLFGSLKNTLKSVWLDNSANHVIRLSTEKENTLWQVFSVYHIPTTNDYIQINFREDTEFLKFVDKLIDRSYYDFNTKVTANDKILTISTCYGNDEKMVIHAKLIKKGIR